jgi:phosphatidylcholine synthase
MPAPADAAFVRRKGQAGGFCGAAKRWVRSFAAMRPIIWAARAGCCDFVHRLVIEPVTAIDGTGREMPGSGHKWRALGVHAFTASGAGVGLPALASAWERDFTSSFMWLALALAIDGVDGALARRARVKEHAAFIDGDMLDNVVDFLTYVVVPAVALMRSGLAPDWASVPLSVLIVSASALYFADKRMKTHDHWFRGFPAIWNVLVFYLLVFEPPGWLTIAIALAGVAGMFAPFVFVHPVRVVRLRALTTIMLALWALSATLALANGLSGSFIAKVGLAATAVYFLALPLARKTPFADS